MPDAEVAFVVKEEKTADAAAPAAVTPHRKYLTRVIKELQKTKSIKKQKSSSKELPTLKRQDATKV